MNYFLICILFLGVLSETISKNQKCTCEKIQSEEDCLKLKCSWTGSLCTTRSPETYCGIQTVCPIQSCAFDTNCVPFTGCSVYSIKTHEECQAISNLCTSNGEQCVGIGQCSDYGTSVGCVIDYKSNYCFWNENNKQCETVTTQCEQLPNTLKTDKECRTQISNCTAGKEGGCVTSGLTCAEQAWESACVTNSSQTTQCIWQDNKCLDYVCQNSPITITTHDDCWKYKTYCTLSDTKTGCIDVKDCALYTLEEQCKIGANTDCKWILDKCVDAICENAPNSYISDQMCQSFLSTCTVDDDKQGCKIRYPSCPETPNRYQCYFTQSGQQCLWNETECVDYSCENAVVTHVTPTNCNLFKNTCTSNDNQVCAQKTCSQGEQESICSNLLNCIWQDSKCLAYNCASASITLTTEEQCSAYKTGCTTNGAGCVTKGQCTDVTLQAICDKGKDINGNQCIWSQSKCKLKECSDIVKTSHKDCNAALDTCTTNGTKCVPLSECEISTSPDTCILGSNGPCLWVQNQCYQYNDCRSVNSKDYSICSAIGSKKQCTTDGSNCIPINRCVSTPIKGCFYGIEGDCVVNLDSEGQQKCEVYKSCSQLKYTTHLLCNSIKSNCTVNSNGLCMDLQASCDVYITQESCQITSSAVNCFWDTTTKACRNRVCTDLLFSSHSQCFAIDSTCTTDNSKCMTMPTCSQLKSESVCRFGTDGDCIYNATEGVCRVKVCSDFTSDLALCIKKTGCVATSTECLSKVVCKYYVTSESCKNEGTDGVCTWTNDACKLMENCSEASQFETACKKKSEVCKWTPKPSNGGSSSCIAYTCATKYAGDTCLPLLTFNSTLYQVCTKVQNKCTESSVSSLSSKDTCFDQSAQTYYWNPVTSKCVACNIVSVSTQETTQPIFDIIVKISTILLLLVY